MTHISLIEAFRRHSNKEPVYIKHGRQILKVQPSDNIRDLLRICNQCYWLSGARSVHFYVN